MKSDTVNIVIYFGPISPKGMPSLGGYAAANRKNIDKLSEYGIKVIEKPKKTIIQLVFQPFCLIRYFCRKGTIVHIATPLAGLFMLPVLTILLLCKCCKIPAVLDIRAGLFMIRYKKYGFFFKWLTRKIICLSSQITVEGKGYIRQIQDEFNVNNISYFPNTVDCSHIKHYSRSQDVINLLYFGRLTTDKGLDVMSKVIECLGNNFHLYLAGPKAEDFDNVLLHNPLITYKGLLNQRELTILMRQMHFFIFPTRHDGEGQSNSLIEAMAQGLIPVISDKGFCSEVVGDCGVVLPTYASPQDYCNAILKICEGNLSDLSIKCQSRITKFHNIDVEVAQLVDIYNRICLRKKQNINKAM
jgi:glycosyltransferase involved in cell wall biosynthesis